MADEFNLSPTNNTEKFLDDILRTAQGEQAQFNLVPNWRIEAYLDAIKNALSASVPVPKPTSGDHGKVLTVANSSGDVAWENTAIIPVDHIKIFDDEITWAGDEMNGTIHVTRLKGKWQYGKPLIVTVEYSFESSNLLSIEYDNWVENGNVIMYLAAPAIRGDATYVAAMYLTISQDGEITGTVHVTVV